MGKKKSSFDWGGLGGTLAGGLMGGGLFGGGDSDNPYFGNMARSIEREGTEGEGLHYLGGLGLKDYTANRLLANSANKDAYNFLGQFPGTDAQSVSSLNNSLTAANNDYQHALGGLGQDGSSATAGQRAYLAAHHANTVANLRNQVASTNLGQYRQNLLDRAQLAGNAQNQAGSTAMSGLNGAANIWNNQASQYGTLAGYIEQLNAAKQAQKMAAVQGLGSAAMMFA
jgi:hypothetical protein